MENKKIKYIIILGPPGSGKGTQAKKITQKFGFFYFGTGDLMREEAVKGTSTGQKFKETFEKGELVADDLVEDFVKEKLTSIPEKQKIIFDGFPRTLGQTKNFGKDVIVLNIEVPTDELLARLSTRKICARCSKIFFKPQDSQKKCDVCGGELVARNDDRPEIVKQRIAVYQKQTEPLIDYFKKNGVLINIDGRPAIEKVTQEINEKLDEILNNAN